MTEGESGVLGANEPIRQTAVLLAFQLYKTPSLRS